MFSVSVSLPAPYSLSAEVCVFILCSPLQAVSTTMAQVDREKIYQWINELSSPETRENALLELSKKRESVTDLAPMLWHSCGTIAALLQVWTRRSLTSCWKCRTLYRASM